MRRRDFITLVGGAAAAWPLAARAQPVGKVWRIGFLNDSRLQPRSDSVVAFAEGMRDLGYVEGKDFVLDYGDANGRWSGAQERAAELVRQKADMILVAGRFSTDAAVTATRMIPIILVGTVDPVGNGRITSLARPGGNVTGLASSADDSAPKQLELLAEIVPNRSRIAVLGNPNVQGYSILLRIAGEAARKAGITIVPMEARTAPEIESAFAALGQQSVQGVLVNNSGSYVDNRSLIVELALAHWLPTMFAVREFVVAGGLMSYGQSSADFFRQAATYAQKIMRGAAPADLPVEQPTRFHLTINLKTARALGLTIPQSLQYLADEVIE